MTSFTETFYRAVSRHFVTLSCHQQVPGEAVGKGHVFSGFLIEAGDVWFCITAGHILRRVRKALEAGHHFEYWRIGDQASGTKFGDSGVPYAFDIDRWFVIEDEYRGLDYAALPLENFYRRQIEVGDSVPLDRRSWGDHVHDRGQWALVGVPAETVTHDGGEIFTAKVTVTPLTPAADPEAAGSKAENQFYAQLGEGSEEFVRDLDGMSGGPLFAIRSSGDRVSYVVIGVQSGWYKSTRVVAACPFASFAVELERLVSEARKQ